MITYAENYEDVILARLFRGGSSGFYVDIGASHPTQMSVTKHFYDQGWSGINVEPIRRQYELFAQERPRDINLNLAVDDTAGRVRFHECVEQPALSTADDDQASLLWRVGRKLISYDVNVVTLPEILGRADGRVISFLKIDVEGLEERVLRSNDWSLFRPRALVIDATRPSVRIDWDNIEAIRNWDAWEPLLLAAGYVFAWYDGLNRFYMRAEDSHLTRRLALPPCIHDEIEFPLSHEQGTKSGTEGGPESSPEKVNTEVQPSTDERPAVMRHLETIANQLERIANQRPETIGELFRRAETAEKRVGELTAQLSAERWSLIRRIPGCRHLLRARYRLKRVLSPKIGMLVQYPPTAMRAPKAYLSNNHQGPRPKFSIVVPTLNQGQFLDRTLQSVIGQDYPSLELIVRDGGSTDETLDTLQRYSSQLHHWESVRDGGQARALNLGFQQATGDILSYLNSDDLLLPDSLHYVGDFFADHPDVDVVYGQRLLINENDHEIGLWILPPHDSEVIFWADYIPQESLFWRRRVWDRVGGAFDESFHYAMDWDLLLRFRNVGAKFVRLPRLLGAFRVHGAQKTTAQMNVGLAEKARLRRRELGHDASAEEIDRATRSYVRKHLVYHHLYRLNVLRY